MDPLTHGLVGLAIGITGGGSFSWANGPLIASLVGSLLPDLDIVWQIRGDYAYLKHHRGFSHSLLGALWLAGIGALGLSPFYASFSFGVLFPWVLGGVLSHLFLDLLNSYGIRIFWPFWPRKVSWNILPLVDLVLILCSLVWLWWAQRGLSAGFFFSVILLYFISRWGMRSWAAYLLKHKFFREDHLLKINVLPARASFWVWDFILTEKQKNIVGRLHLGKRTCQVFKKLMREDEELISSFRNTILGQVFYEFTPFVHICAQKEGDKLICHFMDLRYWVRDRFLHNGTLVLTQNGEVEKAVFQPYSAAHCIYF